MTTQLQQRLLRAIADHGPLTYTEAAAATGTAWADVDDALKALQRKGFVLVFADEHVRLTATGRVAAQEASVA